VDTAILLAVLIAIGFEGLRRLTGREFPDADRRVAEQHARERLARAWASGKEWAAGVRSGGGSAAPAPEDRVVALERLGRLHDTGTLDDEEFRAEKQRILSAAGP
jgi:hypothetical protein